MIQKARIRTAWKNRNTERSVAEFASALSAIVWRISLNAAKNLHQENFDYSDDSQRLGVVFEYVCFLCHVSDRLTYDRLDEEQRQAFITGLARESMRHYAENHMEILAVEPEAETLFQQFNHRSGSYAQTRFGDAGPEFDMYRLLGSGIQEIMGQSQTNRWVMDHVVDIDGPNSFDLFSKSFSKLAAASGY